MKVFFGRYTFFLLLILYIVGLFVLKAYVPPSEQLLLMLTGWYQSYGYMLVFIAAILEGTFVISLYVPGSTAVLLGAAVSRTGVIYFPWVILLATTGLMIGYVINYVLGKYGWYHMLSKMGLEKGITHAKQQLHTHKKKTLFFGYIHPGSASFVSTAAGISSMPFTQFLLYSTLSQLFWSLVWGGLAYLIGMTLVELFVNYFSLVTFAIIAFWGFKHYWRKKKE